MRVSLLPALAGPRSCTPVARRTLCTLRVDVADSGDGCPRRPAGPGRAPAPCKSLSPRRLAMNTGSGNSSGTSPAPSPMLFSCRPPAPIGHVVLAVPWPVETFLASLSCASSSRPFAARLLHVLFLRVFFTSLSCASSSRPFPARLLHVLCLRIALLTCVPLESLCKLPYSFEEGREILIMAPSRRLVHLGDSPSCLFLHCCTAHPTQIRLARRQLSLLSQRNISGEASLTMK